MLKLDFDIPRHLGVSFTTILLEVFLRAFLAFLCFLIPNTVNREVYIPAALVHRYSYPFLLKCTVPLFKLVSLSIVCLILIPLLVNLVYRRQIRWTVDIMHYCLAFSLAFLTLYLMVMGLKTTVRRPRPDFLSRCYNGAIPDLAHWNPKVECPPNPSIKILSNGVRSFPSGHSACVWATFTFLFLYLYEKTSYMKTHRVISYDIPPSVVFTVGFIFMCFSVYVGCSRVWDYKHHIEDVVVGGVLGCVNSILVFYLYYPITPHVLFWTFDSNEIYDGYVESSSDIVPLVADSTSSSKRNP